MATVTVTENTESRQASAETKLLTTEESSAEFIYTIRGTANETIALAELDAACPMVFEKMVRKGLSVEPVFIDESHPEKSIWTGTVTYRKDDFSLPKESQPVINFDTAGGTQHITQSIATRGKYPADAPSFNGAIGYDGQNVTGVDITVPNLNFTETHLIPVKVVTSGFQAHLARMTGRYNSKPFRGFDEGEVLFLGASGSRRDEYFWEITYRFAVSPNRKDFTVGNIHIPHKRGWDYMWVRYSDDIDSKKAVVKKPVAVYIEQVYQAGNFASLGIGR